MTIAILDYNCGEVDIIKNVPQMKRDEEIENYLIETLNYNIDEIYWMDITNGKINFLTPDDF